jgi:hypothetical protein
MILEKCVALKINKFNFVLFTTYSENYILLAVQEGRLLPVAAPINWPTAQNVHDNPSLHPQE